METVKFVCEFFFTNFWHWLGLTITLGIFRFGTVIIDKSHQIISKNNKEDQSYESKRIDDWRLGDG